MIDSFINFWACYLVDKLGKGYQDDDENVVQLFEDRKKLAAESKTNVLQFV